MSGMDTKTGDGSDQLQAQREELITQSSFDLRAQIVLAYTVDELLDSAFPEGLDQIDFRGTASVPGLLDSKLRSGLALEVHTAFEQYADALGITEEYMPSFKEIQDGLLPKILICGGYPIEETSTSMNRVEIADLEKQADERERLTAAILDYPPTDDFVRDHLPLPQNIIGTEPLGRLDHTRKSALKLLVSRDHHLEEAQRERNTTLALHEALDINAEEDNSTIAIRLVGHLNDLLHEQTRVVSAENKQKIRGILNDRNTTIQQIEELWLEVRESIALRHEARAKQKEAAYAALLDSSASRYASPED